MHGPSLCRHFHRHIAVAAFLMFAALVPATQPALASMAQSDISVHLQFSGGAHYATTLSDTFVMPKNQSIANDSCGVWYRDAKHMFFELSVRFDQIQIYSSPVAASGLRLMVGGYQPAITAYPDTGSNDLLLRAQSHDYAVDPDSKVHMRIVNGGRSGSFIATHYSQNNGPATITIKGTWTCTRLFTLKMT
jgi:hypothetical protein